MVCNERNLESLKKDYAFLEKKYDLPDFLELNQEFEIEDLYETETDFLLRTIRKALVEKTAFFSKFMEVILNPGEGGSLFVFSIAKALNQEDRKVLSKVYEKISKLQLESIKRDLSYSEKEEAIFIKKVYSFWKESKKNLIKALEGIDSNWDNETKKSDKSYFR